MSIKKVGIVGSGIMGSGIAQLCASSGLDVVVRSRSEQTAQGMIAGIEKSLRKLVDKGRLESSQCDDTMSRLSGTSELSKLSDCDLVIESVVEDLEAKKHLFIELDRVCQPSSILATNTSTLPVIEMAMATGRPEMVCGVHFFNPAPVMDLVEVVKPLTCLDTTIESVTEFATSCGKTPVTVKDQAGFIVNALLFPYLNNAIRMLESSVASMEDIDKAMKGGCGFPMGPFALLDLVGLDTSLAILDALYEEFRDPNYAAVPTLRRMVAAELWGRKSGKGFYNYA